MSNKKALCFSSSVSPIRFVELMLENTDSNGVLNLKDWYDIEKDDLLTCNDFCCSFKWAENDVDNIVKEYNILYNDLQIIAKCLDRLDRMYLAKTNSFCDTSYGLLNNKFLESTYFIFVAPFKSENKRQLHAEIIGRVGDNLCGYEMIRHARRLCKLLSLNAPQNILDNEGRMLIAAVALYNCGNSIVKIQK